MNNRQLKQVRMFIRMRLFFVKNKLSFVGFLPLVQLIADWLLGLTDLEADITAQGLNETGIAKGKVDKRALMIDLIFFTMLFIFLPYLTDISFLTLFIALRAKSFARDIGV